MFKAPFSFKGRIRRTEYGISLIIHTIAYFFSLLLGQNAPFLFLILIIPIIWFGLAQSVKRSHDLGNTGWYILIPFYGIWLLFVGGDAGPNEYGEDPKQN